jgi:23S rRNA (cytidine2498-2'-O)-methyltransferase
MTSLGGTVYESDPETRDHVVFQLGRSGRPVTSFGDLHLVPGEPVESWWHRNLWLDPVALPAATVSEAAAGLRTLGALWTARPHDRFRRHELIREKLPRFQPKPRPFPFVPPAGSLGAWALRDETTVWASARTSSPFPGGDPLLVENKDDPPSSAYRKLQEALVLAGHWPQPGEVCLDAGSCPGGWTWVLAELGATVHSVDRAPLDPRVSARPNVLFRTGNAFALRPEDFGPLDWFCCDVICYPAKLWDWLQPWLAAGTVRNFVVTVKMQGRDIDWDTLGRFAAVPGSRLVHLNANKHELTWLWEGGAPPSLQP